MRKVNLYIDTLISVKHYHPTVFRVSKKKKKSVLLVYFILRSSSLGSVTIYHEKALMSCPTPTPRPTISCTTQFPQRTFHLLPF